MVRLKGIEPLAHSLEGCCSIHLSYRRIQVSHSEIFIGRGERI